MAELRMIAPENVQFSFTVWALFTLHQYSIWSMMS